MFDCSNGVSCKSWATAIADNYQVVKDNMWFQLPYVQELSDKGVDRFDERLFGNDDNLAINISDHRPAWATFHVCVDDD